MDPWEQRSVGRDRAGCRWSVRDKAEDLVNMLYCLNTWETQPSQSSLSQFGISLGTLLSSRQTVGKIQSGWRTGDEELFREGVMDAA